MNIQKFISLVIIPIYLLPYSFSSLCMEIQPQNNRCWPIQKIKNFYDEEYKESRLHTNLISSTIFGICTVAKGTSCFASWSVGDPCSEGIQCALTGLSKGEYCCDSRITGCFSSVCISGDVICALAGLTALCTWGPCCTQKCLYSDCCKKLAHQPRENPDDEFIEIKY